MSYMSLVIFTRNGIREGEEYHNSRGYYGYIWDCLYDKYVKPSFSNAEKIDAITALANDDQLDIIDRLVLLTTFDYCLVKRKDFLRLINCLHRFLRKYPSDKYRVCHLDSIIDELTSLVTKRNVIAVGWYLTSTEDNPWSDYDLKMWKSHWFLE